MCTGRKLDLKLQHSKWDAGIPEGILNPRVTMRTSHVKYPEEIETSLVSSFLKLNVIEYLKVYFIVYEFYLQQI